jgi:mRNA interferase RelE/StbE
MKYTVLVERYAQKQIAKLDKTLIAIIKTTIANLADNPRPYGYKKLKGEEAYSIRFGITELSMKLTMM